jgi:uncharacterized cupredoxin-like copper-binding protein
MKKIALLSVMVFSLLIATACGSPAKAATQPSSPSNPSSASSSSGSGTQVNISLADNTIKSSLTTFQVGVPYTFVVTNTGNHTHNFNINTPVSAAGSLDAALSSALMSITRDKLGSGASATVNYTFPASAAGAPLEFSCLIKSHYEDGMTLAITVTK